MTTFINRRRQSDRRQGQDRRKAPRLDLSHRRRRTSPERRDVSKTLLEDFQAHLTITQHCGTTYYPH